jgi:hypothetical protein
MSLQSSILSKPSPNARLESAANGGPSLKPLPTSEDQEAVRRLQFALIALGYKLPRSVHNGQPDGKFGWETESAVISFQKFAFPREPRQWDGRPGQRTLAEMDRRLPAHYSSRSDGMAVYTNPKKQDVLVRILGQNPWVPAGTAVPEGFTFPPVVIESHEQLSTAINTPEYLGNHNEIALGTWWCDPDGSARLVETVRDFIFKSNGPSVRVFLIGISRGALNVMAVARALASKMYAMPVYYIGMADPAFLNSAEFMSSCGNSAQIRVNHYQSRSDFAGKEYHGPLAAGGFTDNNLNSEAPLPQLSLMFAKNPFNFLTSVKNAFLDNLHMNAINIGYRRIMKWVKDRLAEWVGPIKMR